LSATISFLVFHVMNEDGERQDERKQLCQKDFQPQEKGNLESRAMGLLSDAVPDRCMSLLHPTDLRNDLSAFGIATSSGKKAVQAIGDDFRLPILTQQRQISFHSDRNLSGIGSTH
jgi:hypothetical protein